MVPKLKSTNFGVKFGFFVPTRGVRRGSGPPLKGLLKGSTGPRVLVFLGVVLVAPGVVPVVLNTEQNTEHGTLFSEHFKRLKTGLEPHGFGRE